MTEPSEHARRAAAKLEPMRHGELGQTVQEWLNEAAAIIEAATAELKADKARLEKLFAISNHESSESKWRVTLDYDNYQDGARVLDGDGKVVAECYDVEKSPIEQFRAAIDAALHP